MKTSGRIKRAWCWFPIVLLVSFVLPRARAQIDPWPPLPTPLDSWSFIDTSNWTDDFGDPPTSFTNITSSNLGNGWSLVVETNVPAWLNYPIYGTNGATNIVLDGPGSICFWYGGGWATTNGGPGNLAQLIEAGEPDSGIGYFGLSIDSAGSNLWFFSQDGAGDTYGLSTPISWTTNYFHFIALTYSETNVSLYLDGQLATNDPAGLSVWPGPAVIPTGLYFGSDTNGNYLAQGLLNSVQTFGTVLDSNTVAEVYNQQVFYYEIMPWNIPYMDALSSAPSRPSTNYDDFDIITGSGGLQWTNSTTAISSTNVWITNEVVMMVGTNMSLRFTIQGGFDGVPYDTFVNSLLDFSSDTNKAWAWMGQGFHGNTYVIHNLPNTTCFLILGTPQDSDFDGLTDAYERLVSKTDPYNADTSGDGISDSDKILQGLNPLSYNPQWQLDSDSDGLPDLYESANATAFGLNPNSAEAPPNLPAYTAIPVQ